jgi:hypothetical protein
VGAGAIPGSGGAPTVGGSRWAKSLTHLCRSRALKEPWVLGLEKDPKPVNVEKIPRGPQVAALAGAGAQGEPGPAQQAREA